MGGKESHLEAQGSEIPRRFVSQVPYILKCDKTKIIHWSQCWVRPKAIPVRVVQTSYRLQNTIAQVYTKVNTAGKYTCIENYYKQNLIHCKYMKTQSICEEKSLSHVLLLI